MGGVLVAQTFVLWGNRRGTFTGRNLSVIVPRKNKQQFLPKRVRKDCRRFLEDLVSTILSTVAAYSPVGRGLRCFCPEIVIGGDEYSVFHIFGHLLYKLLDLGCVIGSEIEPAKAEFQYFVREQRQV